MAAVNPNTKVPVLVDGDFVLWESSAINAYLCSKAPGQMLLPTDPRELAEVNRWLLWTTAHSERARRRAQLRALRQRDLMKLGVDPIPRRSLITSGCSISVCEGRREAQTSRSTRVASANDRAGRWRTTGVVATLMSARNRSGEARPASMRIGYA